VPPQFTKKQQEQPRTRSPLFPRPVLLTHQREKKKHLTRAYSIMQMHTYTNDPAQLLAVSIRGTCVWGFSQERAREREREVTGGLLTTGDNRSLEGQTCIVSVSKAGAHLYLEDMQRGTKSMSCQARICIFVCVCVCVCVCVRVRQGNCMNRSGSYLSNFS